MTKEQLTMDDIIKQAYQAGADAERRGIYSHKFVPPIYLHFGRNLLIEEVNKFCDQMDDSPERYLAYAHERIEQIEKGVV